MVTNHKAARTHGILDARVEARVPCFADKGYRGAGGTIRLPYWGRWVTLSAGRQAVNRSHPTLRALVERAMATLKSWRLCASCDAPPTASPPSSKPPSPCTWPTPAEAGESSMTTAAGGPVPRAARLTGA
ncbi:hypothetical protein GCM10010416_74860 [Streptomyces caniferus]